MKSASLKNMKTPVPNLFLLAITQFSLLTSCGAFVISTGQKSLMARPMPLNLFSSDQRKSCNIIRGRSAETQLCMGLDPVTFMRTEFISAALFTNQIPRASDVCLQLGTYDGRAVNFIPKTIREFITSSNEASGDIAISVDRDVKQSATRRGFDNLKISNLSQCADNLKEVKDDSVDVVLSMQSVEKMVENGLEWKNSVREAGRVLKPGGRLLFVEKTMIPGDAGEESYLEFIQNLSYLPKGSKDKDDNEERFPVFDDVGYDDVDLVIQPHIAGVAIKSLDAGLTKDEKMAAEKLQIQEEYAARSLSAFERGRKKKRKKKKNAEEDA